MSYIGPWTQGIIEAFGSELKKKETKEKILKNLIEPVITEFFNRYYPFITCFMLVHFLTIGLLIYIIYLLK